MSKTFNLTDVKGQAVELSEDVLTAIAAQLIPAGSVVLPATEVAEMKGQIVNLSTEVTTLGTAAKVAEKRSRTVELTAKLAALQNDGRITVPQRTWALSTYADDADFVKFDQWAATLPEKGVLVNLNDELGTGADVSAAAGDRLQARARQIATEKNIPLREALKEAGRLDLSATEEYQDRFRPTAH